MVKQTAGRDQLGTFAPKFAELNDDILFGEVWNREDKLSYRAELSFASFYQTGRDNQCDL
jgi:alkylhydroperoxidase/carboxymuconolactone decarboxylase family protein YurZ